MKLYTLDNQFIKESTIIPHNFTGIIEYWRDSKIWYFEAKRHRLDGPAVNLDSTRGHLKGWFIDDIECSEEQHALLVDMMKLKGLT